MVLKIFTYNHDRSAKMHAFTQMREEELRYTVVNTATSNIIVRALREESYDVTEDELLFIVHHDHNARGFWDNWTNWRNNNNNRLSTCLRKICQDPGQGPDCCPVINIVFFSDSYNENPLTVDFICDNIRTVSLHRMRYNKCHFRKFLQDINLRGHADLKLLTQHNACTDGCMIRRLSRYLILLAHKSLGKDSPFNVEIFQEDIVEVRQKLCESFTSTQGFSEIEMVIYPLMLPGEENCSQLKALFRRLRHCWLETTILGKDFTKNENARLLGELILKGNNWEALERDGESLREWMSMLNEFKGKLVECYSPCQLVNHFSNNKHAEIRQLEENQKDQLSAELNKIYNQKVKAWKCKFEKSADALEKSLESLLTSFKTYKENKDEKYFRDEVLGRWECFSSKAKSLYEVLKVLPGEGVLIP